METRSSRTLNDLKRGQQAHAADVLRLALHYLIRGGWAVHPPAPGRIAERAGFAERPYCIEGAIGRAARELSAPWARALEASYAIRTQIGARAEDARAIPSWEQSPGRTGEDARALVKGAILSLAQQTKGLLLDVVA